MKNNYNYKSYIIKKYVLLLLLCNFSLQLTAQYTLKCKVTLPILEPQDEQLLKQLDSILFVKYPCTSFGKNQDYVYLTTIEENTTADYTISIIYIRPSIIENDVYAGIFRIDDKGVFIVKEKGSSPLFVKTCKNDQLIYEKQLTKKAESSYELNEMIGPEEFCTTILSYSKGTLKLLELGE